MTSAIKFAVASAATLASSLLFSSVQSAWAISFESIADETFFTTFNDTGSNGIAGQPYSPTPEENLIGTIADFGDVGRVSFIQSPPYYLVSPNAWAFAGAGRADINFNEAISSISLAVRGTAAGDQAGANGIFPFPGINNGGAADFTFGDAEGTVYALDAQGEFIAGSATVIENLSLQSADPAADPEVAEINFAASELGQDIFGLAFVQAENADNVGLFVGGLGVTPEAVPEPVSALAVLAVGAIAASGALKQTL